MGLCFVTSLVTLVNVFKEGLIQERTMWQGFTVEDSESKYKKEDWEFVPKEWGRLLKSYQEETWWRTTYDSY